MGLLCRSINIKLLSTVQLIERWHDWCDFDFSAGWVTYCHTIYCNILPILFNSQLFRTGQRVACLVMVWFECFYSWSHSYLVSRYIRLACPDWAFGIWCSRNLNVKDDVSFSIPSANHVILSNLQALRMIVTDGSTSFMFYIIWPFLIRKICLVGDLPAIVNCYTVLCLAYFTT